MGGSEPYPQCMLVYFLPVVTHVVTTVNDDGMCPRTLKYLHALLKGKWIINTQCECQVNIIIPFVLV